MVKDIVRQEDNFPKVYQLGKAADADFWVTDKGSYSSKTLNDDMAPLKMLVTNQIPLSFPLLQPLCILPQSHHRFKSPLLYCSPVIFPVTSSLVFPNSDYHHCQHLISL